MFILLFGASLIHFLYTADFEKHGPYQHGGWYRTVDSKPPYDDVTTLLPPTLAHDPVGVNQPGLFASEFGVSSYSSFESMSGTMSAPYWSGHNEVMHQRNYAMDSIIYTYFGVAPYNVTTPSAGISVYQISKREWP